MFFQVTKKFILFLRKHIENQHCTETAYSDFNEYQKTNLQCMVKICFSITGASSQFNFKMTDQCLRGFFFMILKMNKLG